MAINNPYITGGAYSSPYLGTGFNPYLYNTPQSQSPQPATSNIIWVQGEAGAKAHQTAPGCVDILMDTEEQRFFIKSVDSSGIPQPLRKFSYSEMLDGPQPVEAAVTEVRESPNYVTKDDLDSAIESIKKFIVDQNKKGASNGKLIV